LQGAQIVWDVGPVLGPTHVPHPKILFLLFHAVFLFLLFRVFFLLRGKCHLFTSLACVVELARTVGRKAFAVFQDSLGLDWDDNRLDRASEDAHRAI
jgi:hypothetical protein